MAANCKGFLVFRFGGETGARVVVCTARVVLALFLAISPALAQNRYAASDGLFATVAASVDGSTNLERIAEIDHARLAAGADREMPPSRVLIFSDPNVESGLMALNPLVGIDLPLRILAFEAEPGGESKVIYNSFAYLASRYGLGDRPELEARYSDSMERALAGVDRASIARFTSDQMTPDGIVTLDSAHDFEATLARLRSAINAQDDTVWFGEVDFAARSATAGTVIAPARLLLFGAPGPGGKAMSSAPSLGLDAFCQKILVWQDEAGGVHVSFNDLLALAERHGVQKSIALRVINWRLMKTFQTALEIDG